MVENLETLLFFSSLIFASTTCSLLIACFLARTCRRFLPNTSSSSLRDVEMVEEEAPQGLDELVINAIPSFIYNTTTKSEQEDCSVCLAEFKDNDHVRTLPICSHIFHLDCIDVWLRSHPNCPLCRFPICCHLSCLLASINNNNNNNNNGTSFNGRVDFPFLSPYSFASEQSLSPERAVDSIPATTSTS